MNGFSLHDRIKWKTFMWLMLVIFGALVLTSILSLFYSSTDVQQESIESETAIAIFARELHQRTSFSVHEIAALCTNGLFRTRVVEEVSAYALPHDLSTRLENNEVVALPYALIDYPVIIFKLGDTYLEVSPRQNTSLFQLSLIRVLSTILLSFLFLSVFTFYAGGRIVRPLTGLSQAMQRVSKGDFSVRMAVKKDDELGLLASNFNRMVKELGSIEYLQKDFISNVSHEFKTPIAAISGYAKLLQSPELDETEKKEYTDIIISESQRLSHLSQNLLRLSKIENQSFLKNIAAFSLDEQLRMAVVVLEPEWAKKNIEWDLELDEMDYEGEAELLNQVWLNLLSNAIKFSSPGGRIWVKLYQTDFVKVKIRDEGIGMDAKVQERIFEKFYQGDASRAEEGNGLGLPLVKRIVELSGGSIHVKSAPGEGATFTVALPPIKINQQDSFNGRKEPRHDQHP